MLTIRELIKTLYNAFNQKLKNHRGNWEQNDPTADDYIKNRPFYIDETDKTVIIPKQQIKVASGRDAAASGGFTTIPLSPIIEFVVGQSYDIMWNGKNYICTAYEADGLRVIGNSSMIDGNDTGEPFFIAISKNFFGGAYICAYTTGTHIVEVTTIKIVKIDKKYLPDDITADLAPVATSGNYWDLEDLPEIYSDVVRYDTSQSLTTTQKAQARANIGILQPDWNQSDIDSAAYIQNKPFYDIVSEYETTSYCNSSSTSSINGINIRIMSNLSINLSSIFNVDVGDGYYYINLHDGPTTAYRLLKTYTFTYDEGTYYDTGFRRYREFILGNKGLYIPEYEDDGDAFCIIVQSDDSLTWKTSQVTIRYKAAEYPNAIGNMFDVGYNAVNLVQLNEKYIPDNIKVPKVSSSDVDKVVCVQDNGILGVKNNIFDGITLIDQETNNNYVVFMKNGELISRLAFVEIIVTALPNKINYIAGEYFDPTGMIVMAKTGDGITLEEIVDYNYTTNYLTEDMTYVTISYKDGSVSHSVNVPITVSPFDPEVVLIDFNYVNDHNQSYIITGWKQTLNGEASTEMIIPNNHFVKL